MTKNFILAVIKTFLFFLVMLVLLVTPVFLANYVSSTIFPQMNWLWLLFITVPLTIVLGAVYVKTTTIKESD